MKSLSLKNTDQDHNNDSGETRELLEQVKIEDTPFTAVRYHDKWFLTMGKYRLTEELPTLQAVKDDAERADWFRVIQIIQAIFEENKEQIKKEILAEQNQTTKTNLQ